VDKLARTTYDVGVTARVVFDTWAGLAQVAVVGVLAYAGLLLLLRISGKRTLAKMNAFDLVVSVALGSTLATTLLSRDVAVAEGVLALLPRACSPSPCS
jgi:uncharacterized membrane protein YcaP (DUF421 family)